MAIRGSLKEASLPDVLQLLAMGKKTGCLSVTHRSNFGYIYFDQGRISYASIVNRRDRLGDVLVKGGLITREQLDATIDQQARTPARRLGDLLVEKGLIDRERLNGLIRLQIEEAVYFLFTWTQGTFNFEAEVRAEEQDFLVNINPESLLLEGARRVDEWSLIEKKIPSFDIVFAADHARIHESGAEITREQETVLKLLDGKRDVAAVIDESGLGEFDAGKALYGLVTAGFAHRVGRNKRVVEAQTVSDDRVLEHRNLGVAFYRTGMLDEALREFRRVVDLKSGDDHARFYLGLVLLRQGKWPEAAAALREASEDAAARAAVFHNYAYVLERLGRYDDARAALEEAVKRAGEGDARVQMSLGVLALRTGDATAADATLSAARPLWGKKAPSAAWFHYAALAAALVGDADRAVALLTEGISTHPHSAPLYNNLAVALERRGQAQDAAHNAERGVQEDPGLPQLHKNLGDFHFKAGQYDEALDAYQRAVKLNPALGEDVFVKLGALRARRDEPAEAERCWERALELDPANQAARAQLDKLRAARA
jgi:tetratricopeptide (TPR) repeat protein